MRIGIDCRMFKSSFTGIGRYTFELVKNLQKLSIEGSELVAKNEYVLFFNDPEFSAFTPSAPNFTKVLVNAEHYSITEQTKFLSILNSQHLDLMHFTHFNAPIRYKKPFVVTIHDITHTLFPGKKMKGLPYRLAYQKVIKSAIQKSKKIIAVSNNTKQDLKNIFHAPEDKIQVVYEGVNDEFHPLNDQQRDEASKTLFEKYGITKPYLLYTGVHRYHKNLVRLIQAFKILTAKNPDLKLVITGKDDPLYPEVNEEVFHQAVQGKVVFTGLVSEDDLIALYNLSLAYVFPSLYEGFGLPVLEAMQCGTAVCASSVSSIPEIAGEQNAVFFNPLDPVDMSAKIEQVISDQAFQWRLIQNGFNRVKDFSWDKMAKEIAQIYNTKI